MRTTAVDRRRGAILDAALVVFVAHGVEGATIEAIRELSGASTGSIYHHFGSKDGIAAALYLGCVEDYQNDALAVLERSSTAEHGVKDFVRHHVRWVASDRDRARFVLDHVTPSVRALAAEPLARMNTRFFAAIAAWAERERLRLVGLKPDVATAVWVGPAQEYARLWLSGRATTPLEEAAEVLAESAWRSLRAP